MLGDLAEELHLHTADFKGKAAASQLRTKQQTIRQRIDCSSHMDPKCIPKVKDCDHKIMINNQSKIPLPDLGTGPAQWVQSGGGPSIMLPHKDGIRIFFNKVSLPVLTEQIPELEAVLHMVDGATYYNQYGLVVQHEPLY
eukprot:gnl/TRDRNA2_/TRDRNA2_72671_c0_seq1.p1 gnl/TRDRNA2_/TRDRNA2_72671_c0~~gnl/TRDRNA2_/TRDRNA2_72671_c0_seq1.p1  ORF type:complete len:140 (+),score=20.49 gnl/TRDRNA2_/TRDRNA2_72671_c0_seq1:326-745(+)